MYVISEYNVQVIYIKILYLCIKKRRIITLLIILSSFIFYLQCARNSLYTGENDLLSFLGIDFLFSSPVSIQAGNLSYERSSTYDFGTVTQAASSPSVTFTIQNTGTSNLVLTGTPLVTVTGAGASEYTVTNPGVTVLTPGSSTTFTITFTPGRPRRERCGHNNTIQQRQRRDVQFQPDRHRLGNSCPGHQRGYRQQLLRVRQHLEYRVCRPRALPRPSIPSPSGMTAPRTSTSRVRRWS